MAEKHAALGQSLRAWCLDQYPGSPGNSLESLRPYCGPAESDSRGRAPAICVL